MNLKYEILFTPTKTGSVELKNCFVVCAMESTGIINWLQDMDFNAKLCELFIQLTAGFGRNFTMSQTFYKYRKLLKPVK